MSNPKPGDLYPVFRIYNNRIGSHTDSMPGEYTLTGRWKLTNEMVSTEFEHQVMWVEVESSGVVQWVAEDLVRIDRMEYVFPDDYEEAIKVYPDDFYQGGKSIFEREVDEAKKRKEQRQKVAESSPRHNLGVSLEPYNK